jgi:hypothetical protein
MATAVTERTNGAHSANGHYTPSGQIEISPLSVHVEATFVHPDIVGYAESGALGLDPLASMQSLLVAGIAASRNAGAYALAEEARQAAEGVRTVLVSETETYIRTALQKAIGVEGEEGGFLPEVERIVKAGAKAVESESGKLIAELKGAGEDALPQIIETRVRGAANDVVKQVMTAALAEDGPLGIHLQNHGERIGELHDDLARVTELLLQGKASAEQIDPAAAGREWQPSVLASVARLSLITGDRVEETGDTPGHGRSKKGDAVLHVATALPGCEPKVVVECRTGKTRITIADLNAAKENRSAEAALLLVSDPQALPKDAEELGFRAYWEERSVVLHYEPDRPDSGILLATALQVARMFSQLGQEVSGETLKHEVVRVSITRLEKCVGRLKPLRSSATGIENEVSRIRGYAQEMETELRGALGELGGLIGWAA